MVKGQDVLGFHLSPLKLLRTGLHLLKGIRDMLILCVHNQFLFTVVVTLLRWQGFKIDIMLEMGTLPLYLRK